MKTKEQLAEESVTRYNHKDPWVQYEMRVCGRLSYIQGWDTCEARYSTIHTCHAKCERPGCVQRRRIQELEAEVANANKFAQDQENEIARLKDKYESQYLGRG